MENGDDRLTNVLIKAIKLAKQAHDHTDEAARKELISYIIGSLETGVELIRPETQQPLDNQPTKLSVKGFAKNFLP